MPAPLGKAASRGKGPRRYSIRLPIWLAENIRFAELEPLSIDKTFPFIVTGREAEIESRETFHILWIRGFATISEARIELDRVALALIRLSAEKTAAIQFHHSISKIAMGIGDPNRQFREHLDPAMYPAGWDVRKDGTRTDGGIFSDLTYVIPEQRRIWEYNTSFGTVIRPLNTRDIARAIENLPDDNPAQSSAMSAF